MSFFIHCYDCGEHTELVSRGTQEFCPCSSTAWKSCEDMEGRCKKCDAINRETAGKDACVCDSLDLFKGGCLCGHLAQQSEVTTEMRQQEAAWHAKQRAVSDPLASTAFVGSPKKKS